MHGYEMLRNSDELTEDAMEWSGNVSKGNGMETK